MVYTPPKRLVRFLEPVLSPRTAAYLAMGAKCENMSYHTKRDDIYDCVLCVPDDYDDIALQRITLPWFWKTNTNTGCAGCRRFLVEIWDVWCASFGVYVCTCHVRDVVFFFFLSFVPHQS